MDMDMGGMGDTMGDVFGGGDGGDGGGMIQEGGMSGCGGSYSKPQLNYFSCCFFNNQFNFF